MVLNCIVGPMDCFYDVRVVPRQKRQVAVVTSPTSDYDASSATVAHTDRALTISVAVLGVLLLVIALIVFMKRRRAARRVGQHQELIPTFMDEKSTEEYFKSQTVAASSAPTLQPSPSLLPTPSKAHHRTRSVPVIFGRGEGKDQDSKIETEGTDQFHQISLVEGEGEGEIKKSLSKGFARFRSSTITITTPSTVLHRSVSLNNHGQSGDMGRSAPIEEETVQDPSDTDALPTATNLRFPGLRKYSASKEYSNPSRFCANTSYQPHRKSISSVVESGPPQFTNTPPAVESDPPQFPSTVAEVDPKKSSTRPSATSSDESNDDDTASTVSEDGFDHLPPHQRYQNFEAHDPYLGSERQLSDEDPKELQAITHNQSPMSSQTRGSQGIAFATTAPPQPSRVTPPRLQQEQNLHFASDMADAETQ